ncbi:MAG: serine/threonine protein kinase, partial [Candidatus Eremiobacteraeota bacterium]|nr:serine/threonine protein kinase [Candidatus Eremiobacteraeota bacterium]
MNWPGYYVRGKVWESSSSEVFRAERISDGLPVYLKMAAGPSPSPDRLTMLRHEYRISSMLTGQSGVIATYGLERDGPRLALVSEDFGGQAVDRALSLEAERIELKTLLEIAIGAARALEQVHAAGVLHKDISPANLIWNAATGQVKLVDFGISTTLTSETRGATDLHLLEGTLAYMAPEQTGRMNRQLDQRGDLYGLGATLYRLMTGRPPFKASDPLELVHAHLARNPEPPHLIRPELPPVLSHIL